jgi:hypothetical protein
MTGGKRRLVRTAAALAALAGAAGLAACDGDSSDASAPPPTATATATASATSSGTATAPTKAASGDAAPCALLTPALVKEVFQVAPPAAPDTDSPTMCGYTVDGGSLGDTLSLAVEKWQDGRTVQDELADLGITGPNGQDNPQSLADQGLGPDAVDVWDDSSVAVVWKDGDVHKLVVSGTTREPDSKALLIDVAQKIHTAEQN